MLNEEQRDWRGHLCIVQASKRHTWGKSEAMVMMMPMPMPLHRRRIHRDAALGPCEKYLQQLLDGCN